MRFRHPDWLLAVLPALVLASDVDLSDFDDEVMRAMDDALKDLEPVIGASNDEYANNDLDVLKQGYTWTADYFRTKPNAPKAVDGAVAGLALIDEVSKAVAAKNFEAAAAKARELSKNCKSCHDAYKPLTK
jgi:hypothetical protein